LRSPVATYQTVASQTIGEPGAAMSPPRLLPSRIVSDFVALSLCVALGTRISAHPSPLRSAAAMGYGLLPHAKGDLAARVKLPLPPPRSSDRSPSLLLAVTMS